MGRETPGGEKPARSPELDWGSVRNGLMKALGLPEAKAEEPSAPADRQRVREEIEREADLRVEYYDRSESKTTGPNVEAIRKLSPKVLMGSVDADGFEMTWHGLEFYKINCDRAKEILRLAEANLFEESTKQWMESLRSILEAFAKMVDSPDFAKSHRREIFNLTRQHGEKLIYGGHGVFQFLLAYGRVKNLKPDLDKVDDAKFDLKGLGLEQIILRVGVSKGKEGGKNDRFGLVAWNKRRGAEGEEGRDRRGREEAAPVVKRGAEEEPAGAGRRGPEVPVVPGVRREGESDPSGRVGRRGPESSPGVLGVIPAMGSPEFYEHYEISDRKDFDTLYAEFVSFLDKPENVPDVTSETEREFFYHLDSFRKAYDKFFNDLNNPESIKVQYLFFVAGKKVVAYLEGLEDSVPSKIPDLIDVSESLVEGTAGLRSLPTYKRPALEGAVKWAEFLSKNAPQKDEDGDGAIEPADGDKTEEEMRKEWAEKAGGFRKEIGP